MGSRAQKIGGQKYEKMRLFSFFGKNSVFFQRISVFFKFFEKFQKLTQKWPKKSKKSKFRKRKNFWRNFFEILKNFIFFLIFLHFFKKKYQKKVNTAIPVLTPFWQRETGAPNIAKRGGFWGYWRSCGGTPTVVSRGGKTVEHGWNSRNHPRNPIFRPRGTVFRIPGIWPFSNFCRPFKGNTTYFSLRILECKNRFSRRFRQNIEIGHAAFRRVENGQTGVETSHPHVKQPTLPVCGGLPKVEKNPPCSSTATSQNREPGPKKGQKKGRAFLKN